MKHKIVSAIVLTASLAASPAYAGYQTIDLSSYVNGNVTINAQTFPTGTTTGDEGTGVPFAISTLNGEAGTYISPSMTGATLDVAVNFSGAASFYALLNNYYGSTGADEYDITIKASNGDTITYRSIGGTDTRDYNSATYSNTIASTTTAWYDNGQGQRLDIREFTLPTKFATDTITDFIITQASPTDVALLSGLTFSTAAAQTFVTEPASIAMFGISLFGLGMIRRRG